MHKLVKDNKLDSKLQKNYINLIDFGYKELGVKEKNELNAAYFGATLQEQFLKFVTMEVKELPEMCKHLKSHELVHLCFLLCANPNNIVA